MMCCRMTTCGTFTFEGKSRALPVTVTRRLWEHIPVLERASLAR